MSLCFAKNTFVHVMRVSGDDIPVYAELPSNNYFGDGEEVDAIGKTEQIFHF